MPDRRGQQSDEDDAIGWGTHRDGDKESIDGGVLLPQETDWPDDAIVVDLTKDEESLNWTKYGPEDSREPFNEWSDDKARKKLNEAREKLREARIDSGPSSGDSDEE